MKFAALRSMSHNVGEEIQWLAAERFLPHIDYILSKNHISEFCPTQDVAMIMNGWWTYRPKKFVPDEKVVPLLISMHLDPRSYSVFAGQKVTSFLRKFGPVGCRDYETLRFLERNQVPAYYSGCLTLTLQRNPEVVKNDYVLCVGLSDAQVQIVRSRTKNHQVVDIDALVPMIYGQSTRMDVARAFLALYQGAHCVVTRRLHAALPSLALETPVLLVQREPDNPECENGRYEGPMELVRHVSGEDFEAGRFEYDFDNPPPNFESYKKVRKDLVEKCSAFTGYDNPKSLLTITDPYPFVLQLLSKVSLYRNENWHACYYMPKWQLVKALFKRMLLRHDAWDLYF